jgi:hypothetical protein
MKNLSRKPSAITLQDAPPLVVAMGLDTLGAKTKSRKSSERY